MESNPHTDKTDYSGCVYLLRLLIIKYLIVSGSKSYSARDVWGFRQINIYYNSEMIINRTPVLR